MDCLIELDGRVSGERPLLLLLIFVPFT
jgi:hypothetical protein